MQAAVGISQLKKLPKIIARKKEIHDLYYDRLSFLSSSFIPLKDVEHCTPVHWFTSFLCEQKTEMIEYLKQNKIQSREFFYPLNAQPCYNDEIIKHGEYELSMNIFDRGISLPSAYNLTEENQIMVINKLEEWLS